MLFLGPDPAAPEIESGMVSRIAESRPYEFVSIEHVGIIRNGVEDLSSEEAKKWSPAFENYTFNEKNGGTELIIDMDVEDEYVDMFKKMWEDALHQLKTLVEAS